MNLHSTQHLGQVIHTLLSSGARRDQYSIDEFIKLFVRDRLFMSCDSTIRWGDHVAVLPLRRLGAYYEPRTHINIEQHPHTNAFLMDIR